MSAKIDDISYDEMKKSGTGGSPISEEPFKVIDYPFDRYDIKIKLTIEDKFMEVIAVKVNKDFRSYKQKITPEGFHDVEQFYKH